MQVAVPTRDAAGNVTGQTLVSATRQMTVHDLFRHTAGLGFGEVTQNVAVKEAYAKVGLFKPNVIDYDTRDLSAAESTSRPPK